jgi:DNA repair exonuclease SbcCD nuclease subunit
MSFLVIGDLHFKSTNSKTTNLLHLEVLRVIQERKPSIVVILGDVLNDHEKINLFAFHRLEKFFHDLIETGVELFILKGNHDAPSNKSYLTDDHVLNSFKKWHNTHIIDTCQIFERFGIKFCCIPFVPDGMVFQALKDCQIIDKNINVFFSHSEYVGCKINKISGGKCDIWPLDYPLNISGHIHDKEIVQPNLIYVGMPYQLSFSESSDKVIHLLSFQNGSPNLEPINLNIPKKIYITIDYTELYSLIVPEGEIKIKIVGPIQEVKRLLSTPEMKIKYQDVKIVYSDTSVIKLIPKERIIVPFYERLHQEIQKDNDSEIIKIFQNIFTEI